MQPMCRRIIDDEDAFFRSQQKTEADLTQSEKSDILTKLLYDEPAIFLRRYQKYLLPEDLHYFATCDDYESKFYAAEVRRRHQQKADFNKRKRSIVDDAKKKNRRYSELKRLVKEGDYFSDWEMRMRSPLLYDQMIGQYMTEKEARSVFRHGDHTGATISGMFIDFCESRMMADQLQVEKTEEQLQCCSFTNDEEKMSSSDESEIGSDNEENKCFSKELKVSRKAVPIDRDEKDRLREEYVAIMHERFIDGLDVKYVDYNQIDNDERNDDLKTLGRDCEDEYFDSEEPSTSQER